MNRWEVGYWSRFFTGLENKKIQSKIDKHLLTLVLGGGRGGGVNWLEGDLEKNKILTNISFKFHLRLRVV